MKIYFKGSILTSNVFALIVSVIVVGGLVIFQQNYAKSHNYGIEQPIGLLGIGEYYFRHPERIRIF